MIKFFQSSDQTGTVPSWHPSWKETEWGPAACHTELRQCSCQPGPDAGAESAVLQHRLRTQQSFQETIEKGTTRTVSGRSKPRERNIKNSGMFSLFL